MKIINVERDYYLKDSPTGEVVVLIPDDADIINDIEILQNEFQKRNIKYKPDELYFVGHHEGEDDFIIKVYIDIGGIYDYNYIEIQESESNPELLKVIGDLLLFRYLMYTNKKFGTNISPNFIDTVKIGVYLEAVDFGDSTINIAEYRGIPHLIDIGYGIYSSPELKDYIETEIDPAKHKYIYITRITCDKGGRFNQSSHVMEYSPEYGEYKLSYKRFKEINFKVISTNFGVFRRA